MLRDCDPGDATKDSERGADKPRAALFFTAYTPKTGKKPHAAGDYTPAHLGLREAARKNITVSYFEAGHMTYIHPPSLVRMARELREFVQGG